MLTHIHTHQSPVNGEVAWSAGATSLFKVVKCKLPERSCKNHLVSLSEVLAGEIQCG